MGRRCGETTDREGGFRRALRLLARVPVTLMLACSEVLLDPDYPLASTLVRRAGQAGFRLREKRGNLLSYTLLFEKA